jgi:hypothetical protein
MVESRRLMPAQKRPGHRLPHLPARPPPPPPPAPFRPNPVQAVRIRWDAGWLRRELLSRKWALWLLLTGRQGGGGWDHHRRPTIAPPSYQYHTNIIPISYYHRTTIPRLAQEGREAEVS